MFDKRHEQVYRALVDAAYDGLDGDALIASVMKRCPTASDKQLSSASMLALGDAEMTDPDVLRAIFGLAIARRKTLSITNNGRLQSR